MDKKVEEKFHQVEYFKKVIEEAFKNIQKTEILKDPIVQEAIQSTLLLMECGKIRVSEKNERNEWVCHSWIKEAILLYFKSTSMSMNINGFGKSFDKVPLKWEKWEKEDFEQAAFRCVPGSIVRFGAYIGKNVVLMPSFVNIGAYVGAMTMIDTWSTIGSCAQIGSNCHISGGVGIGGVLEPIQNRPTIIEDYCFIGARSEIAEGVIVEEGSIISMGVFIGNSTKIVNRDTGEIIYGRIPSGSVVIPGSLQTQSKVPGLSLNLNCAVIIKKVDAKSMSKTQINDMLRSL
jgi:2,3,4,5-tetrahydropyridine-2-carboxylate N-succinyltransferase